MKQRALCGMVYAFVAAIIGCSADGRIVLEKKQETASVTASLTTPIAKAEQYRFPLKGTPVEKLITNSRIYRGQSESLVEHIGTGAIDGMSDLTSAQYAAARPRSMAEHDAMARKYFVQMGIPEGEIGGVEHFTGYTGGSAIGHAPDSPDTVVGYVSTFNRVVAGYDVVDSHAGVELAADGTPINFHIHWPPNPPGDVLARCDTLKARLQAGLSIANRTNVSDDALKNATVVLHHSLADDKGLSWSASIRIETMSGTRRQYREFDGSGAEIHPYDQAPLSVPPTNGK